MVGLQEGEGGGEVINMVDKRRQLLTRQSSVWTRRQNAVCVRNAYKRYGSSKNPNVILDGLNMTVPKGNIYGLLGASGCGKTTLLSCIVGRRRLQSGEIWVLGGRPGSRGSGVPGPRIGYMPQDIALYGEFSIRETMIFNGWINGMTTTQVDDRLEFLLNLLMLPPSGRIVKNLSGGQQRRVSFAAALLHEPELLILDEPTVGVDPVLRQSIWDHLVSITKEDNKTVIITTHYIEETRQAHMIGLMRGGHFLAEESPNSLLATHMCDTLEDVFLKLSKMQNRGKRRRSSFMQEVMATVPAPAEEPVQYDLNSEISGEYGDNVSLSNQEVKIPKPGGTIDLPPEEAPPVRCWDFLAVFSSVRMKAVLWKNFLWMWRNIGIMLFIIGLPIIEISLYCWNVGNDPTGLHLAVVNHELNNTMDECVISSGCELQVLSCRVLHYLENRTIILDRYEDETSAIKAVEKGSAWGVISFGANYSESLIARMEQGREADPFTVESADINVWMDMSNQHIGQMLRRDMIFSFLDFASDILKACGYNTKTAGNPIRFNEPVYGEPIPNFRDFAAPGVILTISFFLSVAQTSLSMMIEKKEGIMERSLVSGVTVFEILFSHLVSQFIIMAGQTALLLIFALAVFEIPCLGSLLWVSVLALLSGLSGMCFGFLISCVCDSETSATYTALGSCLPIIMLCGIIWPIEGMNHILWYISFILPLTQSTESLRIMMARAWTIYEPKVYNGFIASSVWIFIYLLISVLVLKFKKG